jgi:hypothetical protein
MRTKLIALLAGAALSATALADDATVIVVPVATEAAVIETAKLDTDAVLHAAAAEAFGLSPGVTTGLIFAVVSFTLFTIGTDGTPEGIQIPVPPAH